MLISGFNPNSYVDFPNNISAVVFTGGCNFNCWYCHNHDIIDATCSDYTTTEVLQKIAKRSKFLDGVVISGGEPTLQNEAELVSFIKAIKEIGLEVKLDTNGSDPKMLARLLPLLDYVAMDIKAPLSKYALVTPITPQEISDIEESIALLKPFKSEFRTTVTKDLDEGDILEIAKLISGGNAYYLQQLIPPENMPDVRVHTAEFLTTCAEKATKFIKTYTRGI